MNESVKKWLDELEDFPSVAIQKLILGYAGVVAWSRSSLRESFIEIYQTHAIVLDEAVAGWLEQRLMKLPPENTPMLVWASHLQDLFSALAGLPLPQVARYLRDHLRDIRSWLRPLRRDESLDPEAAYLAALAWAETNKHLEGLWQGITLRTDCEPAYYTDIGLLGLRKTRDELGRLPEKVQTVLLTTLIDLADIFGVSQKNWLLTTRALLGGYRFSQETWIREFTEALNARPDAKNAPVWLKKILPDLKVNHETLSHNHYGITLTPLAEKNKLIWKIKQNGPEAYRKELTLVLENERAYAKITRDTYSIVRTFNRLASAARMHDSDWAVARAEEALIWDKNNHYNWVIYAQCLWSQGIRMQQTGNHAKGEAICHEAIDTLWTARFRFPWNDVVHNELSHLYRNAGDFWSAEAIYRETMREFPKDDVCRNGLADLLMKSGRTEEAEAIYRETMTEFPKDDVCCNGLADLLMKSGRTEEAEAIYRETMREFPKDDVCRNGLADLLMKSDRTEEAEAIYRETMTEFPKDEVCRGGLADLLMKSGRTEEAEAIYRDAMEQFPRNTFLYNGLATLLKKTNRAEEARLLLQDSSGLSNLIAQSRLEDLDQLLTDFAPPQQPDVTHGLFDKPVEFWETLSGQSIELPESSSDEPDELLETLVEEMRPAQRLGRALLFQWEARHRTENLLEQESLFAKAANLLSIPDELTGECRDAFIEARGFLLLARNQFTDARIYFEEQLNLRKQSKSRHTQGLWLGFAEACSRLGEHLDNSEEAELESFGSDGTILLLVLKVLHLLETTTTDDTLRKLLLEIYPKVRSFAGMKSTAQPEQQKNTMLANVLLKCVFEPSFINTSEDIQNAEDISLIRKELMKQQPVIFDIAEKFVLALAA
jgi:Flp pilus assembly protein TadD